MGRTVLVTGCSTGLGLDAALHLAEQGYNVYATMRDLTRRDEFDREAARRGVSPNALQLDITDQASIDSTVQQIMREAGEIYALVNNAGIGLRGYFEDLDDDEIRDVFDANVFGTMAVTRAVLPHMRAAGEGRIVIISSIGGRVAAFGVSAYCSTKFAQEGFAEALYQEVKPFGINVSVVEPGIVKTERWGRNRGNARRAKDPASPYYRWFSASEEIADRLVETAPTKPHDVSKSIQRAIEARRPRLRYVVGWRPGLAVLLRRYLPETLFERVYFGAALWHISRTANAEQEEATRP
jgi:NAD(P)-dependent dehydrogenase (short-subunit alcohol dehydrogenase family)